MNPSTCLLPTFSISSYLPSLLLDPDRSLDLVVSRLSKNYTVLSINYVPSRSDAIISSKEEMCGHGIYGDNISTRFHTPPTQLFKNAQRILFNYAESIPETEQPDHVAVLLIL